MSLAGNPPERFGTELESGKMFTTFESIREEYLRGARQLGLPERLPLSFLRLWSRAETLSWLRLYCGCADEAALDYQALAAAREAGDKVAAERITRKQEALRVKREPPQF